MSYGSLKLGEGKYMSLAGNDYTAEDFEKIDFVSDDPLYTQGLRIPKSAIPEINKIFGRLLVAIQEASFVHRAVLEVVPLEDDLPLPEMRTVDNPFPDRICTYGSTLSANTLVSTIRQNITGVIQDVLDLYSGKKTERQMGEGNEKQRPYTKNDTLVFSGNVTHEDELGCAELLTPEARRLIDQFGEGCADIVHDLLQSMGESILSRADLSYLSISRDMTRLSRLSEGRKTGLPEEAADAKYSTLNPADFIERMKGDLRFSPAGFILRLPDEIKERILNRMREKGGER